MSSLRRLPVLLVALSMVGATTNATSASAGYRVCKDVTLRNVDGIVYATTEHLRVSGVSCKAGRRVAKQFLTATGAGPLRPFGYRCKASDYTIRCRKGRRRVYWNYPPPAQVSG